MALRSYHVKIPRPSVRNRNPSDCLKTKAFLSFILSPIGEKFQIHDSESLDFSYWTDCRKS
jgi:hypothetical protein